MVNAWHGWTTAADDGVTPMVTRGAVLMSASGTSLDPPWTPWSFYSTVYILGDADDGMTVFREAAYSGLALLRSYDWLQLAISAGALDGSDSSSSHDGRLGLTLLYTV